MKFTEEQYREIVYVFSVAGDIEEETRLVAEYVSSIKHSSDYYKALAIANPETRELAYERFVEKEKKYMWQSKKETAYGEVKRLYNAAIGITDSFMKKTEPIHEGNLITETEIKEWGYNPEMFDKEEVE